MEDVFIVWNVIIWKSCLSSFNHKGHMTTWIKENAFRSNRFMTYLRTKMCVWSEKSEGRKERERDCQNPVKTCVLHWKITL